MATNEYIDFKLYLTRPAGNPAACQVALLPTPEVGETILPVTVSADLGPPMDVLPLLASKDIAWSQLKAIGEGLANWLLPEDTIRERFRAAYDRAGTDGGVRLRLIIADHSLKALPWEYIYLKLLDEPDSMKGFLALNERISIVRHEPLPYPHPAPKPMTDQAGALRMVLASASPDAQEEGLLKLDVEKETSLIQEAIAGFNLEGGASLTADPVLKDATAQQLKDALLTDAYIFHFAGHGIPKPKIDFLAEDAAKEVGYLLLSKTGNKDEVDYLGAPELAQQLRSANTHLAVLGACYSGRRNERYPWDGVAGALAAAEIPAIISMQYQIGDEHAIAFSRALYVALGLGLSLDKAVWSARGAMVKVTGDDGSVNIEWGVPVLYSRLSDGTVFPERMAAATPAAEAFRYAIAQTVTGILSGDMTGAKVELLNDGVEIVQQVKNVQGTLVGAEVNKTGQGARIKISQEIETASGSITGLTLNEDEGGGSAAVDQAVDTVEEGGSVTGLSIGD